MIDSSVRSLGEVKYDNKNCLKRQKTPVRPKSLKCGPPLILLSRYINRSTTKTFPVETLLEKTDSSIKNLGEVEYDKQSRLKLRNPQAWPKWYSKWGLPPFPLYINRSITKDFPIETVLKRTDSSVRNLEEVEYGKQNWLQHQKNLVRRKSRSEGYLPLPLYINWSITKKFLIETLL